MPFIPACGTSRRSAPVVPRVGRPTRTLAVATLTASLALLAAPVAAQDITLELAFNANSTHHTVGLTFYGGNPYVFTKAGRLIGLDATTGAVVHQVDVVPPQAIVHFHGFTAAAGDAFWCYDMISHELRSYRFSDGASLATYPAPNPMPYGMAWANDVLWTGHHGNMGASTPIHGIDTTTGTVMSTWLPGVTDTHGVVLPGGYLFELDNY